MEYVIKALMSPVTWVLIAACLILTLWKVNGDLQHKYDAQTAIVQTLETTVKNIADNQLIIMGDQKTTNELMAKRQKLQAGQATLNQKLQAIPDTSSCKPFDDQNTLDAARLLRDYQNEATK